MHGGIIIMLAGKGLINKKKLARIKKNLCWLWQVSEMHGAVILIKKLECDGNCTLYQMHL